MVKLYWIGHASFWIKEPVSIVMDPFDEQISSNFPKIRAKIVTESHQHFDHAAHKRVGGSFELLTKPEKRTFPKVTIEGFPAFHDKEQGMKRGRNIMFKFSFPKAPTPQKEGEQGGAAPEEAPADAPFTILHAGDLGHLLTAEEVQALGKIDVLCVPVGGTYTLDPQEAADFTSALNPNLVIPMHFKTQLMDNVAELIEFLRVCERPVVRRDSLNFSKINMEKAKGYCVVLTPLVFEK